ncbi:MAG: energy-coupling factor ABC transporter substrate-binding protein [Syntrophomonadaceae bacterium]|nr:energy-coupling factor ABC transporter substrate-binding protein [Syntrophomonadaceae bacterium]
MRRRLAAMGLAAWILLAAAPAAWADGGEAVELKGSDDRAAEAVAEIAPGYRPWAQPLWEPGGMFSEELIFTLQAATGALVLGYLAGFLRGKTRREGP